PQDSRNDGALQQPFSRRRRDGGDACGSIIAHGYVDPPQAATGRWRSPPGDFGAQGARYRSFEPRVPLHDVGARIPIRRLQGLKSDVSARATGAGRTIRATALHCRPDAEVRARVYELEADL